MTAISDMMGLVTEEAIRKALSKPNTLEDSLSLYSNSIWMPPLALANSRLTPSAFLTTKPQSSE